MKKTIKQFAFLNVPQNKEVLSDLKQIADNYSDAKNYFYSRFSGIGSYNKLFYFRSDIRDVLVSEIKNENKYNFNLPARYWKCALDEVVSNIKSSWANSLTTVRKALRCKGNLTDKELHYLNYILKSRELLHNVLNKIQFEVPEKINYGGLDFKHLNRLLRRTVRCYKPAIPYTHKKDNFTIDSDMYTYKDGFLEIQSLKTGKRVKLKVNTDNQFKTTLKIILTEDRICIHSQIDVKLKRLEQENDGLDHVIGIDKNYENVIATSNGNVYGEGINKLFNEYTDYVVNSEKNRNKLRALIKKLKVKGDDKKVERIKVNNLGNKKITRGKNRKKEQFKSLINQSLNQFIDNEKPVEIVNEQLTFTANRNNRNKKAAHKLNSWVKGYIRERIEYKSHQHGIVLTEINAAYTSQTCCLCGHFLGSRSNGDMFYCPNCGRGVLAHLNAASNIRSRKQDAEIKLHQPPKVVYDILIKRNQRLQEIKTGATPVQDIGLVSNPSERELSETCNFL